MRVLSAITFAGVVGLGVPACADTITYDVAFNFSNESGTDEVFGPQFNPALGTLTSVSELVSGTYTPEIFAGAGYTPSPYAALYYEVSGTATGPNGGYPLAYYTLTVNGNKMTGPVQSYSFSLTSACLFCFTEGYPPDDDAFWMDIDVFSRPVAPGSWGGGSDDVSSYAGDVQLTYTYTVPEPSSLAILAFGAGLLGFGEAWRRRLSVAVPSAA